MQEVAHLLPTHIYSNGKKLKARELHDEMVPLRTLDLSADHESIITSNDVFVDLCVLEPLGCRIRHTVVVRCCFFEALSILTLQVDPRYGDFHCDNTVLTYAHLSISSLMPQTERG